MQKRYISTFLTALLGGQILFGQNALTRSAKGIEYHVGTAIDFADGSTPLWLTANRYGLSSIDESNGYLRVGIKKDVNADSLHHWRIGYVADVAAAYNYTSTAIIHQLAADFDYRLVRLSIGAKEQPMAFRNQELSSGSQTLGINARPIPQVWVGLPEYWNITGKKNWAAIRGFISYGMQTDGRFQEDYAGSEGKFAKKVLYHSKAGYLRLGNEDKFPITFEGGLEMATQFGGTAYNVPGGPDGGTMTVHMGHSMKDFVKATFGVGSDPTDGVYANASGNTVGSWLFRLNYKGNNWKAGVYYDHFFEDHSQMFFEYGWLDGLWGVDLELPKNRWVSNLVYEHINTTYQSGPVYHDQTDAIPDQISGRDDYYNHGVYVGWQHWGQAMGNSLYLSPLYNQTQDLTFTANRFKAHHVGLSGTPLPSLHYRLLYSFERSWGTYEHPFESSRKTHSFLAEANFAPSHLGKLNTKGWNLGLSFAFDRGTLLGDNTGFQLKISKCGLLTKK